MHKTLESLELIKIVKKNEVCSEEYNNNQVGWGDVDDLEFCECGKYLVTDDGLCDECLQRLDEGDEHKHPDDPA